MPWPDFSELSFGFSFLREFERLHAPNGKFPTAPDFITQNDEATKGYDVKAALEGSAPVFFQFKRSFVLTTHNAKEIRDGDFNSPDLYRMHLREKESYRQHKALQKMEGKGNSVFYVTSQVADPGSLSKAYANNTVVDSAGALFSPLEIDLPNEIERHHVTFEADANYGFVYSEKGKKFERKFRRFGVALEKSMLPRRSSVVDNREVLSAFINTVGEGGPRDQAAFEIAARFKEPEIKASILAFFLLDAQLTFLRC
jgi:hypothetical protein